MGRSPAKKVQPSRLQRQGFRSSGPVLERASLPALDPVWGVARQYCGDAAEFWNWRCVVGGCGNVDSVAVDVDLCDAVVP